MSDETMGQLKLVYNRLRGQIKSNIGPSFDMTALDKCISLISSEHRALIQQEKLLTNHLLKLAASKNLSKDEIQGIMKVLGYDAPS